MCPSFLPALAPQNRFHFLLSMGKGSALEKGLELDGMKQACLVSPVPLPWVWLLALWLVILGTHATSLPPELFLLLALPH